jgi:nucleotide-binding universal stress UspA family protein
MMYRKILVPLDGSDFAECSLAHVKDIASGCGTNLVILLEAVEPLSNEDVQYLAHVGRDTFEAEEQNREEAKKYLAEISTRLQGEGLNTETVITDGHPDKTITEYAQANGIDLIIMSTHGRPGSSRWWWGSVADRVVHESLVPVLLVSPEGCKI